MPTVTDDGGNPAIIPRTFKPIVGSAANLALSGSSQVATLTQAIPSGGCNVRIATTGTIDAHIRIDPASGVATTNDTRLLAGTVEVFTIYKGDVITAIMDSGSSGTNLNITLGYGG